MLRAPGCCVTRRARHSAPISRPGRARARAQWEQRSRGRWPRRLAPHRSHAPRRRRRCCATCRAAALARSSSSWDAASTPTAAPCTFLRCSCSERTCPRRVLSLSLRIAPHSTALLTTAAALTALAAAALTAAALAASAPKVGAAPAALAAHGRERRRADGRCHPHDARDGLGASRHQAVQLLRRPGSCHVPRLFRGCRSRGVNSRRLHTSSCEQVPLPHPRLWARAAVAQQRRGRAPGPRHAASQPRLLTSPRAHRSAPRAGARFSRVPRDV